jgi:hypothetical protein
LPKLSSNFASTARDDVQFNKMMIDGPGPQDYIPDLGKTEAKEPGDKKPFGVNTKRFKQTENGVPGAGTYKMPDSCVVKAPKYQLASYRSKVEKGLNDMVIGKENPGIGEYDT